MPFKPGQSGNPGGRPKQIEGLAIAIRGELEKNIAADGVNEAIKHTVEIMRTAVEPKDQLAAIKVLLEYGYGKPKEQVEHSVDESLEALIGGSYAKKSEPE